MLICKVDFKTVLRNISDTDNGIRVLLILKHLLHQKVCIRRIIFDPFAFITFEGVVLSILAKLDNGIKNLYMFALILGHKAVEW